MKLKHVIGLLVLLLTISGSKAQVINTDSLNPYPESVVLKVFDVASKVPLTVTEQVALADLLTDEEQTLYNMVINGASATSIDSIKLSYKYRFNSLLTAAELDAYYTSKASKNAGRVARLTAAMLQQKYNTDGTLQQYFNNILLAKETAVNKILLQYSDSAVLDANIATTIVAYDSLTDQYIKAAAGTAYLNSKLTFLDSAVGIDDDHKSSLSNWYYNLCLKNTEAAYADIFNTAFNNIFTQIADSPYYAALYNTEITNIVKTNTEAAIAGYIKKNNLSPQTVQQIMPLLFDREWNLAILNKIYPDFNNEKSTLIDSVIITYQPTIDSLVALDGLLANATQIDIAIKYAQTLQLTSEQTDQLKNALSDLNKQKEEFKKQDAAGEFDSKVFESSVLITILKEEQYTDVLTLKYKGMAKSMAAQDWEAIAKYDDLVNMFDIVETQDVLTKFHLAYLIAYYQNAYDKELQYASCKRVNEIMPEALRILIDKFEYKTAYGDGADTFFQW